MNIHLDLHLSILPLSGLPLPMYEMLVDALIDGLLNQLELYISKH